MADNTVVIAANPATSVTIGDTGAIIAVPGTAITTVAQPVDNVTNVTLANTGPQGPAGISTWQTVHTYAVGGAVAADDYFPPFFFQKLSSQSSILKKVVHQLSVGTSVTAVININDTPATGYTGFTVTTTKLATAQDITLADGDAIRPSITSVSGSPQNLTLTLVIEHTVS